MPYSVWVTVSNSPRSRWSNRDDSSYKQKKSEIKTRTRSQSHDWVKLKADSSAAFLIVGQLTSLVSLTMLYAGTGTSVTEGSDGPLVWGLGENTLFVTAVFGLISFLFLFRVSISRNTPKRRRRVARVWLLAVIIATQLT